MSEFRLPVPISILKGLIQCQVDKGEVLSKDYATVDLMIDIDKGKEKPYRYYAKRWRWKEPTTYKRLPGMRLTVLEWRNLTKKAKVSKREARSKQAVSKIPANQPSLGGKVSNGEAQSKQEVSSTIQTQTTNSTISEDKSSSVVSKTTCEWTNDVIVESWNNFAREHNLKTIRSLSPKRKEWLRLRRKKLGPVLDEVYKAILREPYLTGKVVDWSINFDYLWRNSDNYIKILEGGHWPRSNGNYNGKMNGETIKPYQPRRFN